MLCEQPNQGHNVISQRILHESFLLELSVNPLMGLSYYKTLKIRRSYRYPNAAHICFVAIVGAILKNKCNYYILDTYTNPIIKQCTLWFFVINRSRQSIYHPTMILVNLINFAAKTFLRDYIKRYIHEHLYGQLTHWHAHYD